MLAVLTVFDAPRLTAEAEGEYAVLQSPDVAYRGQMVAAVIAETPEVARQVCDQLTIEYDPQPHDTGFRPDHPAMYAPEKANGGYSADSERGNVDAAFGSADVVVDEWYSTPEEHNNPLEPHTVVALWEDDELTLYDSTQHPHGVVEALAPVLGIDPSKIRVICPYIGGGFGSKGAPHAHDVLASMAARAVPGRAVKFAVTRQDMFGYVGYRAPTASHVRIAADRDGTITGLIHEAYTQSSHVSEFVEQAAVSARSLYRVPNLRTTHRAVALDVPAPFWMRRPGKLPVCTPGRLRWTNSRRPAESTRSICESATNPKWTRRPGSRGRRGDWSSASARVADGSAGIRTIVRLAPASRAVADRDGSRGRNLPAHGQPRSEASIRHEGDDRFVVRIGAADLGTGAWTALTLIAADTLGCRADDVRVEIGDSDLPNATVAGGSSGTSSWGTAIMTAAEQFRKRFGDRPEAGAEITAAAGENRELEHYRAQSYGAHFAEVRVDADTGEIRVPRMLGMFSVGRVINPRTARSQFIGGMCFGISMALFEESIRDERFGHVVNHDLAEYHVPTHADIGNIDAAWLDEDDLRATPTGSRGVGEIGIVGSAAAVVNALWHATGVRVRTLPAHLEDVSGALP